MMDGARVKVMSRVPIRPGSNRVVLIEDDFICKKFRRILPEGDTDSGGYREEPLLQFYAQEGGLRTVRKSDILSIR